MTTLNNSEIVHEEIDEDEEEALLKSEDDEYDSSKPKDSKTVLRPPSTINYVNPDEEDSLINEAAEMISLENDEEKGISNDEIESSDDEDANALQEFQAILKELESNKYAYDKYLRLCELSHSTGDLENIRKAYISFSNVYPLTSQIWQRYINVELSLAHSLAEIEMIESLYKKALKDYYSCDLALELANFAVKSQNTDLIWKEILGTYGLHCLRGQEFFKLYRSYLSGRERDGGVDLNSSEYLNAFVQSYLLELRYPILQMEESYIEFKVFYEKNKESLTQIADLDWEDINKGYFKAKEHLSKILPLEEKLKALEVQAYREKANVYFEYITLSDKFLDENVLQTVYERMVADCCLNAECWLKYIDFIDFRDEFGRPADLQFLSVFEQTADDISKRALRNCSWSPELYIKRMNLLEKMERPRKDVQEVLESAAYAGFQTPEPSVAIWIEYLTYLRRQTVWSNIDECDVLRKNFDLAWSILGQQWGVLADCNCEMLQLWGRLEYGPLKDPKRGKELWTTVMESSENSTKSGLWIEFISLETRNDLEAARKLFSKALNSRGLDNPMVLTSAWERFERCNGTIKSLNKCLKECSQFQETLQKEIYFTKQTKLSKTVAKRKLSSHEIESTKPPKQIKRSEHKPDCNRKEQGNSTKSATFKEHENQEIDLTKDHLRIFLSNLDYNLTEKDICDGLPELKITKIELIRSVNSKSRGFGYAELATEAEVEHALKLDRKSLNGRPLYISSVLRDKEQRQKFKYSAGMEKQKLFVKGLPQDCTQSELEEIFSKYGTLKDVRLVYHKSGKFKQIAYIEYAQEQSAGKAVLGVDMMEFRGHSISVAISAPPPKPIAATSNAVKALRSAPKRNKLLDQKPRMSLIPNMVRKKLSVPLEPSPSNPNECATPKSNADFRLELNL